MKILLCTLLVLCMHSQSMAQTIEPFRLPDVNGESVEVQPGEQLLTVVCFLGTECPLAKLYAPRLAALAGEFPNLQFVGVNSNRQDSMQDVLAYTEAHELGFPVLKDHRNQIADLFDAKRTPEVFVLDRNFAVRYRGRIDDQYTPGVSKKAASRQDLRLAIESLLANPSVEIPNTEAVGCFIGRVREPVLSSDVTYCKQIARVLQQHCVECHREGEIGPFSLEDYDEVVGWADTMLEVIADGRMPPWHANPDHGKFTNARHMPATDKQALQQWVDAGMPYGNADDLPEKIPHQRGWRLAREPDVVVAMSKNQFKVPADGTVEYQYFVVDPGFEEDKWVTGAQIVPGNQSVVHHSIVFVRPPDGTEFKGLGWLTAYVPGARAGQFPEGYAIKIPAKSKLVFQQHYTPNGTEQSDLTKLALTFGVDEDIDHEIYTIVGIDQNFEIPPNTSDHKVSSRVGYLPKHASLRAISPHMHVRGKSFRLRARMKRDGREGTKDSKRKEKIASAQSATHPKAQVLLDVPQYDFNWQHVYQLAAPLPLSQIDKLEFDVVFDNSTANPVNPDPTEYVTWGDQTWEEMAVAFFEVSEPRHKHIAGPSDSVLAYDGSVKNATEVEPKDASAEKAEEETEQKPEEIPADVLARMKKEADRILSKFDKDKDGRVGKFETPLAFRRYAFRGIDANNDKELTREEIENAARYQTR